MVALDQFVNANGETHLSIARFNPDGTLDAGFTPPPLLIQLTITGLEIQANGKGLVVGRNPLGSRANLFWRLNTNGTLETSDQRHYLHGM